MKLLLLRDLFSRTTTLGHLTIDGEEFGDSLEDEDRGLVSSMSVDEILRCKVKEETAIPTGMYDLGIYNSPHFRREVLTILGVPGFQNCHLHGGVNDAHTAGCPLVGRRDPRTWTLARSDRFVAFLEHHGKGPMAALRRGVRVTLEIRRVTGAIQMGRAV